MTATLVVGLVLVLQEEITEDNCSRTLCGYFERTSKNGYVYGYRIDLVLVSYKFTLKWLKMLIKYTKHM